MGPHELTRSACPAGAVAARAEIDTGFAAAWNRAADPHAPIHQIPGISWIPPASTSPTSSGNGIRKSSRRCEGPCLPSVVPSARCRERGSARRLVGYAGCMGIKDEFKNAAAELKGEVKQATGELIGNEELAAEGQAERGIAQADQAEEVADREREKCESPSELGSPTEGVLKADGR